MSNETKSELEQKPENVSVSLSSAVPTSTGNQSNSDSSKNQPEFFDALSDPNKPKKSSFQITKITVKNEGRKEESQDDLDETTNTEDLSLDASRTGDVDHEPSSASTVHSPGGTDDAVWSGLIQSGVEIQADVSRTATTKFTHSRFKVVKIESQDRLKRGRWTCTTFSDPNDMMDKSSQEGVAQSQADSIYYIPPAVEDHAGVVFAPIVYNEGHPVLKTNPSYPPLFVVNEENKTQFLIGPVPSTDDNTDNRHSRTNDGVITALTERPSSSTSNKELEKLQPPLPCLDQQLAGSLLDASRLAAKRTGLGPNSPLIAMVNATMSSSSFADLEDGGTSSVAIDNKIEQAMDLVKSHLMFAVREEVEVLKEQIKDLLEKNAQLEYENKVLREDASPDTLAKLRSIQP